MNRHACLTDFAQFVGGFNNLIAWMALLLLILIVTDPRPPQRFGGTWPVRILNKLSALYQLLNKGFRKLRF